jgi:hypothetical protein
MDATVTLRRTSQRRLEVIEPLDISRRQTPSRVLGTDKLAGRLILSEPDLTHYLRVTEDAVKVRPDQFRQLLIRDLRRNLIRDAVKASLNVLG